jgi:hypothetical protein
VLKLELYRSSIERQARKMGSGSQQARLLLTNNRLG